MRTNNIAKGDTFQGSTYWEMTKLGYTDKFVKHPIEEINKQHGITYLEVARLFVLPLVISCYSIKNLDPGKNFWQTPQKTILIRRNYRILTGEYYLPGGGTVTRATSSTLLRVLPTWMWHGYSCHLLYYPVILLQSWIYGKIIRKLQNCRFLTGEYYLPGGGTVNRATSCTILLSYYKAGSTEKCFANSRINYRILTGEYYLPGGGTVTRATSCAILLSYYKAGSTEKFFANSRINCRFLTGEHYLPGGGTNYRILTGEYYLPGVCTVTRATSCTILLSYDKAGSTEKFFANSRINCRFLTGEYYLPGGGTNYRILTGEYNLPGGGRVTRAISCTILLSYYKAGSTEKFFANSRINYRILTGEYYLFGGGTESITYLEVARLLVPLLLLSCYPITNLDLRKNFSQTPELYILNRRNYRFLTGEYYIPGGGTVTRATSCTLLLSHYKSGSTEKFFANS
uniref:Uncharacterized protein n=1 Tax=Vespula pensylvanica TaxID=30213 RepID=A0A834P598_VESPE|nr:hypothetical protein H0235_005647 [Vespula pensylvanica]